MTITVLFISTSACSTTADRLYNKVVKDDFRHNKVEAECAAEDDYSSILRKTVSHPGSFLQIGMGRYKPQKL